MSDATTKTRAGFRLRCPLCGSEEGLTVVLNYLNLRCTECDDELSVHDLQSLIDEAQRLIRWLESAGTV